MPLKRANVPRPGGARRRTLSTWPQVLLTRSRRCASQWLVRQERVEAECIQPTKFQRRKDIIPETP